jgi:lysophospholipase
MSGANHSFAPEPHFLVESLRAQTRFHDPLGDSLFSHTGSVEGYRAWTHSSSGRSSPTPDTPPSASLAHSVPVPTLLVRSSRPFVAPPSRNPDAPGHSLFKQVASKKLTDSCYEIHLPSLVTPRSIDSKGSFKRIRYAILEVGDSTRTCIVDMKT